MTFFGIIYGVLSANALISTTCHKSVGKLQTRMHVCASKVRQTSMFAATAARDVTHASLHLTQAFDLSLTM